MSVNPSYKKLRKAADEIDDQLAKTSEKLDGIESYLDEVEDQKYSEERVQRVKADHIQNLEDVREKWRDVYDSFREDIEAVREDTLSTENFKRLYGKPIGTLYCIEPELDNAFNVDPDNHSPKDRDFSKERTEEFEIPEFEELEEDLEIVNEYQTACQRIEQAFEQFYEDKIGTETLWKATEALMDLEPKVQNLRIKYVEIKSELEDAREFGEIPIREYERKNILVERIREGARDQRDIEGESWEKQVAETAVQLGKMRNSP